MTKQASDLSLLARGSGDPANDTRSAAARVPLPHSRWKTRVLLPTAIFAATVATLVYAAGATLRPALDVRVVPVMIKAGGTEGGTGSVTVQAPGWVEADPFATAVSALTDGIVQDVLVLEGETVHADQIVARLVPDDARIAVAQATANLNQRNAELRSAQTTLTAAQGDWDNPVELTRAVATAEANLAEKRAELDRWPAELARDEAHAVYLEAEYRRIQPIHQSGQASDIELIQAQQAYLGQQAVVTAMRGREPIIKAQIAALEADVQAARDNLRLRIADRQRLDDAKAAVARAEAAIAAAQAAHDNAALWLERTNVRSPADGVVMVRLAEPGAKVMLAGDNPQSAQVLRIYDPRKLQVRVDVPLVDAAKVGVGQAAEVIVDVLPERVFRGRVTRIVHQADVQKNTLQVKVAIDDPSPEITPEMLARARFLATAQSQPSTGSQRVFAPEKLVRHDNGRAYVWLADQANELAVQRDVTPGSTRSDGWIAINDGLHPGDRLIVDAPDTLRNGQRLRIVGEQDAGLN